jgi:hypothetical protein
VALAPRTFAFHCAVVGSLLTLCGCQNGDRLERAGIAITPPASWQPVDRRTWMVPGDPLAAWSGPEGASLVVYRTLWVPGGTAEMLAEALGNRLENLPGSSLLVKRTETAGGLTAARVETVAPGAGNSVAPSGLGAAVIEPGKNLIPTRTITLAFARNSDTISITCNLPQSSYERIAPEIQAILQSLRLSPGGAPRRLGY